MVRAHASRAGAMGSIPGTENKLRFHKLCGTAKNEKTKRMDGWPWSRRGEASKYEAARGGGSLEPGRAWSHFVPGVLRATRVWSGSSVWIFFHLCIEGWGDIHSAGYCVD